MAHCGDASIELNAIINGKMENKKLRLGEDKCFRVHICLRGEKCNQLLKVHEATMKDASQVTYLGDAISDSGTIYATIAQWGQKAESITHQTERTSLNILESDDDVAKMSRNKFTHVQYGT